MLKLEKVCGANSFIFSIIKYVIFLALCQVYIFSLSTFLILRFYYDLSTLCTFSTVLVVFYWEV